MLLLSCYNIIHHLFTCGDSVSPHFVSPMSLLFLFTHVQGSVITIERREQLLFFLEDS